MRITVKTLVGACQCSPPEEVLASQLVTYLLVVFFLNQDTTKLLLPFLQ
jgi:hypothetical protein